MHWSRIQAFFSFHIIIFQRIQEVDAETRPIIRQKGITLAAPVEGTSFRTYPFHNLVIRFKQLSRPR